MQIPPILNDIAIIVLTKFGEAIVRKLGRRLHL